MVHELSRPAIARHVEKALTKAECSLLVELLDRLVLGVTRVCASAALGEAFPDPDA
jgi:hypothetical protein